MSDKKIVKMTKVILDMMYFSGIAITIMMPLILRLAGKYYAEVLAYQFIPLLFTVVPASLFGVMILYRLRCMIKTVIEEKCFVWENVRSLELMAIFSFFISFFFIGKMFFVPSAATLVVIIVFFVAALFSQVLSFVFRDAIIYKEENDLTI